RPGIAGGSALGADQRVPERLRVADAARQIDRSIQQFARTFAHPGTEQCAAKPAQNPAAVNALVFSQAGESRLEQTHRFAFRAKEKELDILRTQCCPCQILGRAEIAGEPRSFFERRQSVLPSAGSVERVAERQK